MIFIIILFLTAGCAAIIRFNVERVDERLAKELDMVLRVSEMTLPPAIWQFNYDYLDTYIAGIMLKERLVYFGIRVESDQIVKKSGPPHESESFSFFQGSSDFLCKTGTALYDGKSIGVIQVAMTRKGIYRELVFNVIGTTGLVIIIILVISAS